MTKANVEMKVNVEDQVEDKKVLSIFDWRLNKEMRNVGSSYLTYLEMLSASQLLSEAKGIITDIKSSPVDNSLITKGDALLLEISNRLENDSSLLSKAVRKLRDEVLEKLKI
ncbi:MAG: hypothetical protein HOE90_08505 [Bacteriovoracaceae bacterium]|nr:hypothetical protein [Bacteriovoracaceae bacterium]